MDVNKLMDFLTRTVSTLYKENQFQPELDVLIFQEMSKFGIENIMAMIGKSTDDHIYHAMFKDENLLAEEIFDSHHQGNSRHMHINIEAIQLENINESLDMIASVSTNPLYNFYINHVILINQIVSLTAYVGLLLAGVSLLVSASISMALGLGLIYLAKPETAEKFYDWVNPEVQQTTAELSSMG